MSDIRKTLKLKDDLRHKDVVALEDAIYRQPPRLLLSARDTNRGADVYIRAAIEAGWIAAPKVEYGKFGDETRYFVDGVNVDELLPWEALHIGNAIDNLYRTVTAAPKN